MSAIRINAELLFRPAVAADVDAVMAIIRAAQEMMRLAGSQQWQDGYPDREHILGDVAGKRGYVLCDAAGAAAYGAVAFDGEPAYDALAGEWPGGAGAPYVVVHRLAVAERARRRGVAAEFMHRVERLAKSRGVDLFRIDTNFDNDRMLALLRREGFVRCGEVSYRGGSRLAFEKRIG